MILHPETGFEDRRQDQCIRNFRPLFESWGLSEVIEVLAVAEHGDRLLFRETGNPITENTLPNSAVYRALMKRTGPDRELRRYDKVGVHGKTARFGWAGIAEPSEQPIFHQIPISELGKLETWAGTWWLHLAPAGAYVVEIDWDHYSKVRDLAGVMGHFWGEYVFPRVASLFKRRGRQRTDPFKIRAELIRKRGFDVELAL